MMKHAFTTGKDVLLSRDGLALARLHRWDLVRGKKNSSQDKEMEALLWNYDETLGNAYRERYDLDNDIEVYSEEMGNFLIEEHVAAHIPRLETGWMFP